MGTRHVGRLAVAVLLVALVVPCAWAQGPGKGCDVTGTWQNGAYIVTITPMTAGRYYFASQFNFDPKGAAYASVTNWVGEMVKSRAGVYDIYVTSYATWKTPEAAAESAAALGVPVDWRYPEIDAVRSHVRLDDCNTMSNVIDAFFLYFPTEGSPEKIPFVTAPDVDFLAFLGIPALPETYHRVPATCPACGPVVLPAGGPAGLMQK